jgi:L-asparaginase/Glu-tRNA(Gln) amidotransferase subunit D
MVVAAILIPHLHGVILETYGSGNAPTEDWFINLLTKAIQSGLKIVNVTQCSGECEYGTIRDKYGHERNRSYIWKRYH